MDCRMSTTTDDSHASRRRFLERLCCCRNLPAPLHSRRRPRRSGIEQRLAMGEMDGLSLAFAYPLLQWGCDGNSAVAERTMAVRRGDERISLQGCATGGVLGSKLRD